MAGKRKTFKARIERPDQGSGAFVSLPFDVEKEYGTRGHVKVKAWFDGYPYRGIAANMGTGCHILIVRKDVRAAIGKDIGDKVTVELEHDTEERVLEVPKPLEKALAKSAKARKFFDSLSFTNRKEYCQWISSAKREETREKRLASTIEKLLAGKKNPSEK